MRKTLENRENLQANGNAPNKGNIPKTNANPSNKQQKRYRQFNY